MGHDGVEGERAVAAEHLDEDAGEQKKPHQQQQKKRSRKYNVRYGW
jgi:hypothetical protein